MGITVAGDAPGAACLAAQAIDIAVSGNKIDDRLLAGALVPVDRADARSVGAVLHGVNSVAFAAVFRLIGRDLLAGPMWLRGVVFALTETNALYPLSSLEPYHPAIRDGRPSSYRTPEAFAQQVWRHVVLGISLELLTPKRG